MGRAVGRAMGRAAGTSKWMNITKHEYQPDGSSLKIKMCRDRSRKCIKICALEEVKTLDCERLELLWFK